MSFIHDDFLLQTQAARRLFHEFAEEQPILDYHNHLPPGDIARNRQFKNLFEIWLEGDHYKWRALRANGVSENLVTGEAPPREKFMAWAKTVPATLRNPLYHWTHLELKRYFGIDELLDEKSAPAIWDKANEKLQAPEMTTQGILKNFKVRALCTTDDPAEAFDDHQAIAKINAETDFTTRVYPTFRPDKAFAVHQPDVLKAWLQKLTQSSNIEISSLGAMLDALKKRHDDFHEFGARLSDCGLSYCYADFPTESEAKQIFARAFDGQAATSEEQARFAAYLMLFFGTSRCKTRLDKANAHRRATQQQFQSLARIGAGHRLRFHRRLAASRNFDGLSRPFSRGKRLAENRIIQSQSGG